MKRSSEKTGPGNVNNAIGQELVGKSVRFLPGEVNDVLPQNIRTFSVVRDLFKTLDAKKFGDRPIEDSANGPKKKKRGRNSKPYKEDANIEFLRSLWKIWTNGFLFLVRSQLEYFRIALVFLEKKRGIPAGIVDEVTDIQRAVGSTWFYSHENRWLRIPFWMRHLIELIELIHAESDMVVGLIRNCQGSISKISDNKQNLEVNDASIKQLSESIEFITRSINCFDGKIPEYERVDFSKTEFGDIPTPKPVYQPPICKIESLILEVLSDACEPLKRPIIIERAKNFPGKEINFDLKPNTVTKYLGKLREKKLIDRIDSSGNRPEVGRAYTIRRSGRVLISTLKNQR